MKTLLVGSHFRPPAVAVLAHLPAGAKLRLQPEADNPYDEHAIRVYVPASEIPSSEHPALEAELPAFGSSLEEVLALGEIWLGYLAASGGRPLQKAQMADSSIVGNQEASEATSGRLAFGPSGDALVVIEDRK